MSESNLPIAKELSFFRLQEKTAVSTITGEGNITVKDIKDVPIHSGDFVMLDQLDDFKLRLLSLANGLHLSFWGNVGKVEAGREGAIQDHRPSLLTWLYHQQTLSSSLYTVAIIIPVLVAILRIFKLL